MVDEKLFNEKLKASGLKKTFIAEKLGITPQGLYLKIKNVNDFTSTEIQILTQLLRITSLKERDRLFFASKVDI